MTADRIITAILLIQSMEEAKKTRTVIKDYSIESVTEAHDVNKTRICVRVRESAIVSGSFFYFVDTETKCVYDAHHYVVYQE